MNKYFIKTDKDQYGPIPIELLRKLPLKRDMLLWNESFNSWQKAEDIKELEDLLKKTPPLLNTDQPIFFSRFFLKKKLFSLLIAKFLKRTLLISISLTFIVSVFLWLRFQPNKFGDDDVNIIEAYWNKLSQRHRDEENELRWKYFSEHPEKNPFEYVDPMVLRDAPNRFDTIPDPKFPYEKIYDFWDYCQNANEQVFLDLHHIEASFKGRKSYLIYRIIRISLLIFCVSFFASNTFLLYQYTSRMKRESEPAIN